MTEQRVRLERWYTIRRPRHNAQGRFQRTIRQGWMPQSQWIRLEQIPGFMRTATLEVAALYRWADEHAPHPGLWPAALEFIYAGDGKMIVKQEPPIPTIDELLAPFRRLGLH